jgi:hypothetical protein
MLLAIEMSIFSVIHIFAFSAKPYDIRKNPDPNAAYSGGFLGWKAFLDAFNLWDIVKAAARGFRWLFVGSRHREKDSSYEEHRRSKVESVKLDTIETQYPGPQYPKPGFDSDDEFGTVGANRVGPGLENQRPRPTRRATNESDDHAALLQHSQGVPKINVQPSSPYHDSGAYREDPGPFREEPPVYGGSTRPYDSGKPR